MQKFKVGDKVRCVDSSASDDELVEGGIYKIKGFHHYSGELVLEEICLSWMPGRFELYEAASEITVESALAFLTSKGYTVALSKA